MVSTAFFFLLLLNNCILNTTDTSGTLFIRRNKKPLTSFEFDQNDGMILHANGATATKNEIGPQSVLLISWCFFAMFLCISIKAINNRVGLFLLLFCSIKVIIKSREIKIKIYTFKMCTKTKQIFHFIHLLMYTVLIYIALAFNIFTDRERERALCFSFCFTSFFLYCQMEICTRNGFYYNLK